MRSRRRRKGEGYYDPQEDGIGVALGPQAEATARRKGQSKDCTWGRIPSGCRIVRRKGWVRCTAGTGPAQACSNQRELRGGEVKRAGTGPVTISNRGVRQREARDAGTGPAIVISNQCEGER
eukprot:478467-Rhodomonas_salina.6